MRSKSMATLLWNTCNIGFPQMKVVGMWTVCVWVCVHACVCVILGTVYLEMNDWRSFSVRGSTEIDSAMILARTCGSHPPSLPGRYSGHTCTNIHIICMVYTLVYTSSSLTRNSTWKVNPWTEPMCTCLRWRLVSSAQKETKSKIKVHVYQSLLKVVRTEYNTCTLYM